MGQLVDGKWSSENILFNHDDKGLYFKRDSVFRNHISNEGNAEFPAEPGRYHLYCAVACPWAHRATLMRTLKRLEPFVTLTDTFQETGGQGWSFGEEGHIVPGTDRRVRWLHELYATADPTCTTRVTVPTLWDAKSLRVVNNESSEIIRMFNTAFSGIARPTPDYYPEPLRPEIEATNALVLKGVNNAVNGCGYSISQEAYDSSVKLLFGTLDSLEERLSQQRYLCGDVETEADWRPGAVRPLLLRRLQVQPAPARRVSQSLELPSRPLPDSGHCRSLRHRRHEARRVRQSRSGRLERDHPGRPRCRLCKAARPRPLREEKLSFQRDVLGHRATMDKPAKPTANRTEKLPIGAS
jgi:putative glutathione S-transferase